MITQAIDKTDFRAGDIDQGVYQVTFHDQDDKLNTVEGLDETTVKIVGDSLDMAGIYNYFVHKVLM